MYIVISDKNRKRIMFYSMYNRYGPHISLLSLLDIYALFSVHIVSSRCFRRSPVVKLIISIFPHKNLHPYLYFYACIFLIIYCIDRLLYLLFFNLFRNVLQLIIRNPEITLTFLETFITLVSLTANFM